MGSLVSPKGRIILLGINKSALYGGPQGQFRPTWPLEPKSRIYQSDTLALSFACATTQRRRYRIKRETREMKLIDYPIRRHESKADGQQGLPQSYLIIAKRKSKQKQQIVEAKEGGTKLDQND